MPMEMVEKQRISLDPKACLPNSFYTVKKCTIKHVMFTRVPTLCNKYINNLEETFTLIIAQTYTFLNR